MSYSNRDYRADKRENRRDRRERDRIPEDVKFYKHLTSFVIINVIFMIVTRGRWMPIPLFWGIGLFFHYIKAFGIGQSGFLSQEWEEERREQHRNRDSRRESSYEEEEELELRPLEKEERPTWSDKDLV